ncbi:MAG: STY0301 family protein [Candidatus Binatus sp.]
MKRVTLNLIAFACTIVAPQIARAQATCPATISVEQKASAPAADWTITYSGFQTAVAGVTIFDGPPSQQASLVPDNEKTIGDAVTQTWRLVKSDRGYWLQCEYANTTVQIYRRLPADVSRCDVTYERNVRFGGEGRRVIKKINCE